MDYFKVTLETSDRHCHSAVVKAAAEEDIRTYFSQFGTVLHIGRPLEIEIEELSKIKNSIIDIPKTSDIDAYIKEDIHKTNHGRRI